MSQYLYFMKQKIYQDSLFMPIFMLYIIIILFFIYFFHLNINILKQKIIFHEQQWHSQLQHININDLQTIKKHHFIDDQLHQLDKNQLSSLSLISKQQKKNIIYQNRAPKSITHIIYQFFLSDLFKSNTVLVYNNHSHTVDTLIFTLNEYYFVPYIDKLLLQSLFLFIIIIGLFCFTYYFYSRFLYNLKQISKINKTDSVHSKHQEINKIIHLKQRTIRLIKELRIKNIKLHTLKNRAIKANEDKTLFLAKMSHELRTPLNGIIGYTQELIKIEKTHQKKEYLYIIHNSSIDLLSIINNIIYYAQNTLTQYQINKTKNSLYQLIHDMLPFFRYHCKEKKLQFLLYIDPNLPDQLYIDPLLIRQILNNIINNAIKFTTKGHVKLIVLWKKNQQIQFIIEDSGIGLSKQEKNNIFNTFYRTSHNKQEGFGLGLAITQEIILQLHGTISCIDNRYQGTSFMINLPIEFSYIDKKQRMLFNSTKFLLYKISNRSRHNIINILNYFSAPYTVITHKKNIQKALTTHQYYFIHHDTGFSNIPEHKIITVDHVEQYSKKQYLISPSTKTTLLSILLPKTAEKTPSYKTQKLLQSCLIVDDHMINIKLLLHYLQPWCEHIEYTQYGKEAITLCKNKHYDGIFIDLQLPDVNGIETTKILRYQLNIKVPIIAISANIEQYRTENDFSAMISKPINEKRLLEILNQHFYHQEKKLPLQHKNRHKKAHHELFILFIKEIGSYIEAIKKAKSLKELKKSCHQLHGIAAIFQLNSITHLCTLIENGHHIEEVIPEKYELIDKLHQYQSISLSKVGQL